jgi:lambda family phage tail tape measure protein
MTDVIGKGVIEVSADASKLKAGIDDAKKSIKSFGKDVSDSVGTASARASKSIDNYVKSLQTAAATNGKSAREIELYRLALRGASEAQLGAANNALRLGEAYEKGAVLGERLRASFITLAAAATSAAIAGAAGTIALIGQVGQYQDLAEKIGDTAVNVSSLKTASDVSGASLDTIAAASVKLTAALSKTDDESKLVGSAIQGLGLDFDKFKQMSPVEQLEAVAQAMDGFAEGSERTAYAVALFGKNGADLIGFLKEYAQEGRNAAYVTEEQAKAADDYADASARLQSQIHQFLQVAAVNAIPILNEVADLFKSISKEQDGTTTATDIVKGAINGLVVIFQALVVIGSDVIFTFNAVGREIGAIAAQLAALGRLDFKGFSAISDAVREDAVRARAELDKFQARVMAIGTDSGKTVARDASGDYDDAGSRTNKPRLDRTLLNQDKPTKTPKGRVDNSAAQEAKAQLTFDLDEIRKAQEALSNTIGNSEKILEAKRSASLISESEYYAKKREFIQENDRVQQAAAQKEIDRLQAEVLTGKNKIDNDRKIADAQAKLNKLRENATANLEILSIKEKDALGDIERAYKDAEAAAKSYLDVVSRAAQAEIAGVGKGQKARDRQASISGIEEKFEAQRQSLQRDNRNGKFAGREEDYRRELALLNSSQEAEIAIYTAKYKKLDELQGNWVNGATEALQNYADEADNIAKHTEEAFTNAFKGLEDQFTNLLTGKKFDAKKLLEDIQGDVTRNFVKENITGPLAKFSGGLLGAKGAEQRGNSASNPLYVTSADGGLLSGAGGSVGSSSGSSGDWLTSLVGAAADAFGGTGATSKIANAMPGDSLDNFLKLNRNFAGRAIGGPVSAGGMYEVNEKGTPELLNVAGKQYLMTGNQGGQVTPLAAAASAGGDTFVTNVQFQGRADRETGHQLANRLSLEQRRAARLK